eukprot:5241012-Amphidinium_carterae.1
MKSCWQLKRGIRALRAVTYCVIMSSLALALPETSIQPTRGVRTFMVNGGNVTGRLPETGLQALTA